MQNELADGTGTALTVAFGLRPVRRLLLRRRRRRLRGIVHPLQHAHDGVEPRLRVLALLARPPASNPRGELRRGSSMQDGQQAKLTLPCVGRGIPERNVAGVGGSAERPEEATAVCARAHLWLAAAALRDAADLSSCAHHVCGEPKPALVPAQLDDSRHHPCCATFQEAARRNVRVFAPPPCACLGAHRSISEQFNEQARVVAQVSPSSFSRSTCRCSGKKSVLRRSSSDI